MSLLIDCTITYINLKSQFLIYNLLFNEKNIFIDFFS